jgi:hypothetical protein
VRAFGIVAISRLTLSLALPLLLTACTTPTWSRPATTVVEFEQDNLGEGHAPTCPYWARRAAGSSRNSLLLPGYGHARQRPAVRLPWPDGLDWSTRGREAKTPSNPRNERSSVH